VFPTAIDLTFSGPLGQEWTAAPTNPETPDETSIWMLTGGGIEDSHFLVPTTVGPVTIPVPPGLNEDKVPGGAGPGTGSFLSGAFAVSGGWNAYTMPVAYITMAPGGVCVVAGAASYNTHYPPQGLPIEEPIGPKAFPEPATLVLLSLGGLLLRRRS
jgi:hypothetical protein